MRSFYWNLCLMAALTLGAAACGGDDDGGNGPSNTAPTADFDSPSPCTLTDCTFTDLSTDADGTIESRLWEFEGGTPETSTEQVQAVTFATAGPHTVTLTVTDNEGATDEVSGEVTVTGTTPGNQPPTADFTVECSSLDCTFTNASADADGTFTSSWDFGDGSPASTEANPVHSYDVTELTPFTVTLTVTDDDGDTDVATQEINVAPPATLTCGTTPDCSLVIDVPSTVTVTLVSEDCELSGNTFRITEPVEETLFTDGCNETFPQSFDLQDGAEFGAGTEIRAQVISGGATLELPPAIQVTGNFTDGWTLEFDDGAQSEPPEPDFNDLIITIKANPTAP